MLNITQIPAPRVDLIDPKTGLMSREWFRFFNNIYTIVGANQGVVQIENGGTGLSTLPTNGQLLIGNTTTGAYVLNTITAALGVSVANGAGTITIANTGVLSNVGGIGIGVSSATGDVTITNTGVLSTIAGAGISVSSATGNVTIANTGVLSVSGTAPVVSSGGAAPAISMAAATTSVNGYLTSTDWTTFNNKQPAGTYVTNLTGPITSVGNATSIASQTGTGTKFVVDNTPTLITPVLGVATATSINKMAITAPATSSTLAVADGKTFTVSKSLTLTGTDTTTMTFPTTTATIARTDAAQTFTGAQTLGNDNLIQGTAAKGINFTANTAAAGMTSQLLNWYEEGTWTPVFASAGGTITSYTVNAAKYTRIGRQLALSFDVTITNNGTGAVAINVTGLPFAAAAAYSSVGSIVEVAVVGFGGFINQNSTTNLSLVTAAWLYPGGTNYRLIGSIAYNV